MKIRLSKKQKLKVTFLVRLTFLGFLFQIVWRISPNLFLLKLLVARIVAVLTGGRLIADLSGVFVVRDSFTLMIVTDCTGWKEMFVFLALLVSWPKDKSWGRAALSLLAIFVYNILRLAFLVFNGQQFDYYHPAFQLVSIFVIVGLWLWSILVKKKRKKKYKSRKKKKK